MVKVNLYHLRQQFPIFSQFPDGHKDKVLSSSFCHVIYQKKNKVKTTQKTGQTTNDINFVHFQL